MKTKNIKRTIIWLLFLSFVPRPGFSNELPEGFTIVPIAEDPIEVWEITSVNITKSQIERKQGALQNVTNFKESWS